MSFLETKGDDLLQSSPMASSPFYIPPSSFPLTGRNRQRCDNNKTLTVCFVFRARWWHGSLQRTKTHCRWSNFKTICCNLLTNEVKAQCILPFFRHIHKMPLASSKRLCDSFKVTGPTLLTTGKCKIPKLSLTLTDKHYNRASSVVL